nr:glycoside hydrolase family 6 protein [Streptomyces anulatus]
MPYATPDRDCGGASRGGAPDLAAYDAWIRQFAEGLGAGPAIVILEPDSITLSDCLSASGQAARFASPARGRRVRTSRAPHPRRRNPRRTRRCPSPAAVPAS